MFSLSAPGVVPEPVRTSFGWHAIRVTEILPAEETPYEKAAPILRKELSVVRQTAAMQELLKDLSRAHPVQVMKDVDDKHFIKAFLDVAATKGSGWVDYKWPNPVSKASEKKSTYVEKAGDLVIICGIYKG